jgi:hypothetical protein
LAAFFDFVNNQAWLQKESRREYRGGILIK